MSALKELDGLVGDWTMAAMPPGGPPWPGGGRVTFEWLEKQAFLIQRWTVDLPEAPDGIAIIGPKESGDGYAQHYFDSRGVARTYETSFENGVWKLWREGPPFAQRFTARLEDEGKTIAGRWEKSDDGSKWETDFDLTYTKVK